MEKMIECKNVVFKYSTGEEGIEKFYYICKLQIRYGKEQSKNIGCR